MTTTSIIDNTSTGTGIFRLVRYVDGQAQTYVPYTSGCNNCCGAVAPEEASAPRSCCGH